MASQEIKGAYETVNLPAAVPGQIDWLGYERGDYYVGNYFDIEQYALVTGGIMHRYISMSNPFENSLFMEESYVTGRMSVQEVFSNHGLKGGPKAITLAWYELF